jgi:RNA polymerase sigma factor (sigma-70 family)
LRELALISGQRLLSLDVERLFADHADELFAFLVWRTGNRAMAEDLLGDTFERALRARRRFDPRRGRAKTWLFAIALNRLRDVVRRGVVEREALERAEAGSVRSTPSPDGDVEARDMVSRALAELADQEREAVTLRFGGELTVPEMARLLGVPASTISGRLYRGLAKLRLADPHSKSAIPIPSDVQSGERT